MLAELEDKNAYMSYQAMNVSIKYSGSQTLSQKGLKPETSYTALVMLIDNSGNRAQVSAEHTTAAVQQNARVESELFETLLGEWTGVQTITDGYAEPIENEFTVNIVASVDDVDYDYRANNQLVALVDGWCSVDYYSVTDLVEYEIEDPELKWGPKWVLDIAEGDVVTIDGYARHSVVGWMFFGDCFMFSADYTTQSVTVDTTLSVTLSEDGNTLTITSPAANCYPSLVYNFEGFGWMAYYYGASDIVLTRK
jgi:chitodextrinase